MKITMKSGAAQEILCHGHDTGVEKHVGPSDLRTSGPIEKEIAAYLRGETAKPIARGNLLFNLAFAVTRECASAGEAERFCVVYPRDVLRGDICIIEAESGTGAHDKLSVADALLEDVTCEQTGCTVTIAYRILGGAIT